MENNKQIQKIEPVTAKELTSYLDVMGLSAQLTDKEKVQFLEISQAFGLNPFKREIYCSKYNNQTSIIVGYETYIKRAERSGQLDGWQVVTEGKVEDESLKAIITIHRKDRKIPFIHEVYYSEYVQKTRDGVVTKFWQKAFTMTKKVAIAQGFRLCFSDELGGMPYTADELDVQIEDATVIDVTVKEPTLTEKIEDAKATLIVATAENFGSLWKSLSQEMQSNAEVLAFGKELKDKLIVKK
jgi:phage recombination protein Bet